MREILFRGKDADTGKWIEGFYVKPTASTVTSVIFPLNVFADEHIDDERIEFDIYYKVIPETAGQYTGLTDRNGKKIFEGDIAQVSKSNELYEIKFGEYMPNQWYRLMGEYTNDVSKYSLFGLYVKQIKGEFVGEDFVLHKTTELEIIGNIYDNPELMEV